MLRLILVALFYFLISPFMLGSTSPLDSLDKVKQYAIDTHNDTLLYDVSIDIMKYYDAKNNMLKVDTLYMEIDSLANLMTDKRRKAAYYSDKVPYYGKRNKIEQAAEVLHKAIALNTELQDSAALLTNYSNLGLVHSHQDNSELAVESYLRSLDLAIALKKRKRIATIYTNLSAEFSTIGDYDLAIDYALKGKKVAEETGFDVMMSKALNNFSILLELNGKVSMDSIQTVQLENLSLAQKLNYKQLEAKINNNIGTVYWKNEKFDLALPYLKEAEKLYLELGYELKLKSNYTSQGNYFLKVSDLDQSKKYFLRLLSKDFVEIEAKYKIAAHEGLMEIEKQRSNYKKAMDYAYQAISLKDTLSKTNVTTAVLETEAKYSKRMLRDSLAILDLEKKQLGSLVKFQQLGIFTVILFLICLIFLSRYIYKQYTISREQNDRLIFEKSELEKLNSRLKTFQESTQKSNSKGELLNKIQIRGLDKSHYLQPQQIYYVSAEDDGTRFHLSDHSFWSPLKLKESKSILPESFIKIYRSTIINVEMLEWVNHATLKLTNGTELKIGRTYKEEIKNLLKG